MSIASSAIAATAIAGYPQQTVGSGAIVSSGAQKLGINQFSVTLKIASITVSHQLTVGYSLSSKKISAGAGAQFLNLKQQDVGLKTGVSSGVYRLSIVNNAASIKTVSSAAAQRLNPVFASIQAIPVNFAQFGRLTMSVTQKTTLVSVTKETTLVSATKKSVIKSMAEV